MAIDISQTGCAILIGDPAVNMVSAAYDHYTEFATAAYTLATKELEELQALTVSPIQFGVSYNIDSAILGYQRPSKPARPSNLDFHSPGDIPDAPSVVAPTVVLDTAPTAPTNPVPTIRDFALPGDFTATAPDTDVTLQDVPTVARPDYVLPAVPTLADLALPDAPTINLPTFDGVKPDASIDLPLEDFSFTPEQYTSDLLDKVSGRTSSMLDGGTGLPANIAQALRDRAFAAIDGQEYRATQQATEEYAARGFAEPSGILQRRLAEVRQQSQAQRNAASRDIAIQDQQVAVENLRFAVAQAISLESSLFGQHNEFARIGLEAAQVAQNFRIRIFEARVSLVQLQLSAYQTDAQVWRERLQGELSKLDLYRAELAALQVKGELNLQQVQLYEGQLRGVAQLADLYRTDIEAARLVVATNQQQLDIERSKIENFSQRVQAYRAQWDAYATQLSSNSIRANVYQLVEQGYATRVRSWSETQQQKLSIGQFGINVADLNQRSWRARVDKVIAEIQAETARVNAASEAYRTDVAAYGAEATVETAASDANLRALTLAADRERNRTDVALRNAEIAINQLVQLTQLLQARQQTIAQTSSQLAAASMSAVNFGAHVSTGRSQSQSCGTSFSYSGSLDDVPAA